MKPKTSSSLLSISATDLAWLAGLLEGGAHSSLHRKQEDIKRDVLGRFAGGSR